jgi:transposase-like protein
MSEPNCPTCGAKRPNGWLKSIRQKQSRNIRKALAKTDKKLGRPRYVIDEKVIELRKSGMSIRNIAWELKVSTEPVKRVLKELNERPNDE